MDTGTHNNKDKDNEEDFSQRILQKMRKGYHQPTSSLLTPIITQRCQQNQQKSTPMQMIEEKQQIIVLSEAILLENLSKMLDCKLAPLANKLAAIEEKVESIGGPQTQLIKKTMPESNDLMKSIEVRFDKFFSDTLAHTNKTISEGINYYNNSLAEREDTYRLQHEASTKSYLQLGRTMIDDRLRVSTDNFQKVKTSVAKLDYSLTQNNKTLTKSYDKLTDMSDKMDDIIKERRRQDSGAFFKEIDPEDIIDLDEEDIYQILIDRLNLENSLIAMSNDPSINAEALYGYKYKSRPKPNKPLNQVELTKQANPSQRP